MSDQRLQTQQDNVRIPAYDTEGYRADNFGLDQMLINCFAETIRNPLSGDGEIVVSKRTGILAVTGINFRTHFTGTANTQIPLANYCVTNLTDVYVSAWVDGTNIRIIQYRPQAGTTTLLGTIATAGQPGDHRVYFSHGWVDDASNPTWCLTITFEDGYNGATKAYTCEASGTFPNAVFTAGSIAQITAATSPWGAGIKTRGPIVQYNNQWYVAALDGWVYNTGNTLPTQSYVSNADIVTTPGSQRSWCNSANFISSEFPEQFEGIILYKHHLVAFGKTSIQFFTDEGEVINPGSPMLRTDQALIRFGCISGKHMISVDDVLYWIGYGRDNTVGLWKLDGYTPVKLSNKRMDGRFAQYYQQTNCIQESNLFTILCGNKKHIGISGVVQDAMPFLDPGNDGIVGWPGGASDTQPATADACRGYITMYNLEDKTWWVLHNGQYVGLMHTATSFGNPTATTYNIDPYYQYILKGPTLGTSGVCNIHQELFTVSPSYAYEDAFINDGDIISDSYYVQMTIQFNGIEFQNMKRKRFNRVTVVPGNTHQYVETYVGSVILLWSDSNTDNTYDTINHGTIARRRQIPSTNYRYYWNNLGMARHRNFSLIEKSPQPWSVRALEIDLAQGTN